MMDPEIEMILAKSPDDVTDFDLREVEKWLPVCPFCGGKFSLTSDYSSELGFHMFNGWHICDGKLSDGIVHGYGVPLNLSIDTQWCRDLRTVVDMLTRRPAQEG